MKPELLTSCPNTYEQEYFLYVTDCGYTDRDARLLTSELSNLDYRRYTDDPSLRALYEYVKGKCIEVNDKTGKNLLCLDWHESNDQRDQKCDQFEIFVLVGEEKKDVCLIDAIRIEGAAKIATDKEEENEWYEW